MTDYYISSLNGSDDSAGTGHDMAWQSLSMLDRVELTAGDRVFLEAGSVFNDTLIIADDHGTEDNPILITSYGDGDTALITSDSGNAVVAARTSHVVMENIAIGETVNSGVAGWDSDYWTIRNVTFDGAGGSLYQAASIGWSDSHDLVFEHNTILNTYGDGLFMDGVESVRISNNYLSGINGANGDNVQIIGSNVIVENNVMVIGAGDNTTKGNLLLHGENFYVSDNYLAGGAYGMSLSADQVVVDGNTTRDHNSYSWSMGIGINDAATGDFLDGLVIRDNDMSGAPNGISFYGAMETTQSSDILTVTGLEIEENYFHDWTDKAVKFTNLDVSGVYSNNTYFQPYDEYWSNSYANSTYEGLVQGGNIYVDPALAAVSSKTVTITASASIYDGAPVMFVYHNGSVILKTEVLAEKRLGESEEFSFELTAYDPSDTLEIKFFNDKYNYFTKEDRNLYIHDLKVEGQNVSFWDADFSGKAYANKSRSQLTFSSKGTVKFTGDDLYLDHDEMAVPDIRDLLDLNEYLQVQESNGETIGIASPQTHMAAPDYSALHDTLDQVMSEYF